MTTHDHTDPADAAFDPTQDAGAERTSEDASAAALRMDLLGGSSGGIDAAAGAPRRFGGQAVLLGMVLLAAGGALFAMRYLGMGPRSSRGEEVKIDYDIDKAPAAGDHMRVLADLGANRSAEQVPPDQVQRNPFRLEGQLSVAKPDAPVDTGRPAQDPIEAAQRERARKVEAAFAGLELHTVLGGSNPIARVSGQTVRPGDKVAEFFTVAAIEGRSVSLECDGKVYVLSLSEEK